MSQRGDIVLVEIPFYDRPGSKERPAVIVQCNRNNARLLSTLVAGLTTNIRRVATEPTQFLIDPATSHGASAGLSYASAVKCENLATIPQTDIVDTIGQLSDPLKGQLNDGLKAALDLP